MTMKRAGRHAWSVRVASSAPGAGSVIGPTGAGSRGSRRLELVQRRDDLRGVALGLDLRPDPRDPAVGTDEERRPRRAPVGLPVVLLLDPRAVRLGDGVALVGEQRERQLELLAEGAFAGGPLRADPPHVGPTLVDGLVAVAELARLDRAAWRVVLGVEVQDGPSSALIGQAMDGPCVIGEGHLGSEVADGWQAHGSERSRRFD